MKLGKLNQQGQTLLEVVFVALIFLLLMSSLVTTHLYLTRAQTVEFKQFIAAQLAREGIEAVRNIRDRNWLNYGPAWDNGLHYYDNPVNYHIEKGRLEWDPVTGGLGINFAITDIKNAPIFTHTDNWSDPHSYWNHHANGGVWIGFNRLLTLEKICDGANFPPTIACGDINSPSNTVIGYKVKAEVQWPDNTGTKSFVLVDYLYNWK